MIPLVLALWDNPNLGGVHRLLIADTPDLRPMNFNDRASAVGVHAGPDYEAWKLQNGGAEPVIAIYPDINYVGQPLVLITGGYPDLGTVIRFNDMASSVRFYPGIQSNFPPAQGVGAITPIPYVVEAYTDANYVGKHITIVEEVQSIFQYFGREFSGSISSLVVSAGPSYDTNAYAPPIMSDQDNHVQNEQTFDVGSYPHLNVYQWNDRIRSVWNNFVRHAE
jgi:hypothetical protein